MILEVDFHISGIYVGSGVPPDITIFNLTYVCCGFNVTKIGKVGVYELMKFPFRLGKGRVNVDGLRFF